MKKAIIIPLLVLFIVLASLAIAFVVKANTNDGIVPAKNYKAKRTFDVCGFIHRSGLDKNKIADTFPYETYLDSANIWHIASIKKDLECLAADSIEEQSIHDALFTALTSRLQSRLKESFSGYQPDSMLALVLWAERFQNYAAIDGKNSLLFESIYDFWMDRISAQADWYAVKSPDRKYDFKYKYLRSRLVEKRFNPPLKYTGSEKFIDNLIHWKWGHLVNATWNQTSLVQKLILLAFLLVTLFGFYSLIIKTINLIKK